VNLARARREGETSVAASLDRKLLTVAVPTCNGAPHLAAAIQSILSQDGVPFELLVSDDRSDDDTIAVARAAAGDRARIEINSERLGLAGNWNRSVALAQTRLVTVFHQDDVMLEGHLSAHAAAFTGDNQIGLVASASGVIDESGNEVPPTVVERGGLGPADRLIEPGRLAEAMAAGNPMRCSAVTLRVDAFHDSGGFDPSYRYVVDWDLWIRLSRRWKVGWLAQPTVLVRWHRASETHRFKTGMADLNETARMSESLFAVDLADHPNVTALRRAANERLARAFLNRADDALRAGLPDLAAEALRRATKLSPGLIKTILRDPRLSLRMAAVSAAPRLAARLFARPEA
jgi:glycosyltransferase involved in cell wall biosynthesis